MAREVKYVVYVVLVMLSFASTFPLSVNAQSKHNILWKICNYCFDFTTNPMTIRKLYDTDNCSVLTSWYVDANGDVSLEYINDAVYDRNGSFIDGSFESRIVFFIPSPYEDNIVFGVSIYGIYTIDIAKASVTGVYNCNINPYSTIVVASADCDFLWLIDWGVYIWNIYSIREEGIAFDFSITLSSDDYSVLTDSQVSSAVPNLMLSSNCLYYTLDWPLCSNVSYLGRFDRASCTFTPLLRHVFSDYDYTIASCISYDESRIYYILLKEQGHHNIKDDYSTEIIEVMMKDGVPDYDNYRKVCDLSTFWYCNFYYGPDGNVYVVDMRGGEYGVLEIIDDKTIYTPIVNVGMFPSCTYFPIASWYLSDPCDAAPSNPCGDLKKPVILWK